MRACVFELELYTYDFFIVKGDVIMCITFDTFINYINLIISGPLIGQDISRYFVSYFNPINFFL